MSNRDAIYLETSDSMADEGLEVGSSPRSIAKSDLEALGHPLSPVKAIRAKCVDCSGGNAAEVRKCPAYDCALWPFRMGSNPFHSRARSDAE